MSRKSTTGLQRDGCVVHKGAVMFRHTLYSQVPLVEVGCAARGTHRHNQLYFRCCCCCERCKRRSSGTLAAAAGAAKHATPVAVKASGGRLKRRQLKETRRQVSEWARQRDGARRAHRSQASMARCSDSNWAHQVVVGNSSASPTRIVKSKTAKGHPSRSQRHQVCCKRDHWTTSSPICSTVVM